MALETTGSECLNYAIRILSLSLSQLSFVWTSSLGGLPSRWQMWIVAPLTWHPTILATQWEENLLNPAKAQGLMPTGCKDKLWSFVHPWIDHMVRRHNPRWPRLVRTPSCGAKPSPTTQTSKLGGQFPKREWRCCSWKQGSTRYKGRNIWCLL